MPRTKRASPWTVAEARVALEEVTALRQVALLEAREVAARGLEVGAAWRRVVVVPGIEAAGNYPQLAGV